MKAQKNEQYLHAQIKLLMILTILARLQLEEFTIVIRMHKNEAGFPSTNIFILYFESFILVKDSPNIYEKYSSFAQKAGLY